ncbi:MAG: hypothetical protein ACTSV8_00865, partial [Candidatus Thorarchaeota archaeon]
TRDRQILASIAGDERPLEDLLSFFASFYVYNYQGLRLFSPDSESSSPDRKTDLEREERRQLELEIRQLLGNTFREEVDVARLVSEFFVTVCDELGPSASMPQPPDRLRDLVVEFLSKISSDYSPNASMDFINAITGWGAEFRHDLYTKASGLKESALTLRDELIREHEEEIIEISTLKRGIVRIRGQLTYLTAPLRAEDLSPDVLDSIVRSAWENICARGQRLAALKIAHEIRMSLLDFVEEYVDTPTTLERMEQELAKKASEVFGQALIDNPGLAYSIISAFVGLPEEDVKAALRQKGLRDPVELGRALMETEYEESVSEQKEPEISKEELENIERSMLMLEKIEKALNGPVKGMLRARGLRAAELEKIGIDLLTKDESTLVGIERQVLAELRKKVRVPPPDEMQRLIDLRARVQSGEIGGLEATSATEMIQRRVQNEAVNSLRLDLVWHLMIGVMTNVARVVETYLRSKHDLLRIRAVLKSIYEETEMELQYLREEILIDLLSLRIYEMKCVHPELDAPTVCAWLHARLSNKSFTAAKDELLSTPSPVYEGIVEASLALDRLEFNNYAIAYDVMHRFLTRQRLAKARREELALEEKRREQEMLLQRRKSLNVLNFIYTKAHTVFRVIGRVGTRGLEWGPSDDMKCANLLAFYIQTNRGRPVCKQCGATPKDGVCPDHGRAYMGVADDIDNLSVFVMRAMSDIKEGLMGSTAEPVPWEKARAIVQREISSLKRQGRITSKTNIRELLPGEINNIIGPRIASLIGKYFNESLQYAARRANLA